jgi:hypothetical protein
MLVLRWRAAIALYWCDNLNEYQKYIEKDKALNGVFRRPDVGAPTVETRSQFRVAWKERHEFITAVDHDTAMTPWRCFNHITDRFLPTRRSILPRRPRQSAPQISLADGRHVQREVASSKSNARPSARKRIRHRRIVFTQ